jgi:hypothetical protein
VLPASRGPDDCSADADVEELADDGGGEFGAELHEGGVAADAGVDVVVLESAAEAGVAARVFRRGRARGGRLGGRVRRARAGCGRVRARGRRLAGAG